MPMRRKIWRSLSRSRKTISPLLRATSLKLPLAVDLYSDMQQSGWPANFNDLRLGPAVQLNPHGIEAKVSPPAVGPFERLEAEGSDPETLQALLDQWER